MFKMFREVSEIREAKQEEQLPPLFALVKDHPPLTPEEMAELDRPIAKDPKFVEAFIESAKRGAARYE